MIPAKNGVNSKNRFFMKNKIKTLWIIALKAVIVLLIISCENQSPVMKPVSSLVESLFRLVSELNSVVSQSLTTVRSAICHKSSLASVVCTHKYVCTFIKPCIVNNTYRASLFADYSAMRRVTASGF